MNEVISNAIDYYNGITPNEDNEIYIDYIEGCHDAHKQGEIIKKGGGYYRYIAAIPNCEEIELMPIDSDDSICYYIGNNFFKVWEKVTEKEYQEYIKNEDNIS